MSNDYHETRVWDKLTVNWAAAVITYAAKVARYGFLFGASVAGLAVLANGLPASGPAWLRALLLVITGGGLMAGLFGGAAVIIKDHGFPYIQPRETIRILPKAAAPDDMKPRPLMRADGNTFLYGRLKLEPDQFVALAQAILVAGESTISQRKLAEWNVVPTKESDQAKQLKADIEHLAYGTPAGNGQLTVTPAFREYLAAMFPALAPHPVLNLAVSNGGVDRHHHQTPPNGRAQ